MAVLVVMGSKSATVADSGQPRPQGMAMTATPSPIAPADIRVIDGDTVRLHGARPDVRLVG